MLAFKDAVKTAIPEARNGPIFGKKEAVSMTIKFYLKRPNSDFVRGIRNAGALKACFHGLFSAALIRPDIDNLCKFVLDSCNGILYYDDFQVVKLVALKLRDNTGNCMGRTVIEIAPFQNHEAL
ncbi:unknown protein [Seminavis robusta]|uniref:Uncharacterized protein n=1 Tax=Seminavis robusta TaxID=568900 RepID=A0A9N8DDU4_9STRA|nr:unknown protein [Seminavis robusta]|eukprot:Sro101_g051730.1 n/a (124) ;mRNA; f:88065-88436